MPCHLRRYKVLDNLYWLDEAENYGISKSFTFCVTRHPTQQSTEKGEWSRAAQSSQSLKYLMNKADCLDFNVQHLYKKAL